MSLRWALGVGSLLAHGVMLALLGEIRTPAALAATAIEVLDAVKPEPPAPAKVESAPEPAPEAPRPKARAAHAPEVAPAAAHAAPMPVASPLGELPDFGLELSGGGGSGGLAVAAGTPGPVAKPALAPVQKTLTKARASAAPVDTCDEPPAKPKLRDLPKPAYTEAARAAGIEGKVRVEITVDETGKVVEVKALTTLGHGLDEAAVAAARAATFEAALRCGKPSRSTFTLAIRFSAT